ncbi:MAG: hypothetical protein ACTSU5_21120 [Promethearchaeota archaeon]
MQACTNALDFNKWRLEVLVALDRFVELNLKVVNDLVLEDYSARLRRKVLGLRARVLAAMNDREVEGAVLFLLQEVDFALNRMVLDCERNVRDIQEVKVFDLERPLTALNFNNIYKKYFLLMRANLLRLFTKGRGHRH